VANILNNLGIFYHRRGEWSLALEHFQRGLEVMARQGDQQGAVEMQANIDMIRSNQGEARSNVEDYLRQLDSLDDDDLCGRAEVQAAIAGAYADHYDWNEAIYRYSESLALFERLGDTYGHAQTAFNMALLYKDKGDWPRSGEMFERSLGAFLRLGALPCVAMCRMNYGIVQSSLGKDKEAEENLSSAQSIFESMGAVPDLCESCIALARFKLKSGSPAEGRFYLTEAETMIYKMSYEPMRISLHMAWGEFYQAEGSLIEASRNYQKALVLSRKLCNTFEEARALRHLGVIAMLQEDYLESSAKLSQASAIFSRLGAMYDLMSLYHDLATLSVVQGDYARAEEISTLLERQGKLLGYADLTIRALVVLANCETKTGRLSKAKEDYARALNLAKDQGGITYSQTLSLLMEKVIEYNGLLENLAHSLDACR
jgi:tetratricopeptide (TPR) repeat protein